MKKQSLVLFFSVISLHAVEHDRTVTFKKHNNVNVDIHGFARLDTFFDTRQGMKSPDGSRYIYPLQKDCDDQCCDINDRGSLGFAPGISRLDFSVTGPKINNINL